MYRYEDEHFYYVRKPHGMPTTFGSQFSFLQQIEQERPAFFEQLSAVWTREEERGLLNRLDNDTGGLIYFAKSKQDAERYYEQQDAGEILKRYICDVQGDMGRFANTDTHVMRTDFADGLDLPGTTKALCVTYPIMHHAHDDTKMMLVRDARDMEKGRGKQHMVKTYFVPLYYDEETDTTTAYAVIAKGIRHQIRMHAAGIGYALIGDVLYKGKKDELLHLRSVGVKMENF